MNPLIAALLRDEFYSFVRKVFETVCTGDKYLSNWHIEYICMKLEDVIAGRNNRLIINLPPRSLKSIIVSVALPAFLLGLDPSRRIIVVSYSDRLSAIFSNQFRSVVESEWYREIFPGFKLRKNSEPMIQTTRNGYRLATSVGGTITGVGADYIIIDDPLKPEDAGSELLRDNANRWFSETLYSRLNDKVNSAIILVMQRLHELDMSGHLLDLGGYEQVLLSAIAEEEVVYQLKNGRTYVRCIGEALHPAREPIEALDAVRQTLGRHAFSAQYQQLPVPTDGSIIKKKHLKYYKNFDRDGYWDNVYITCDAASKTGERNDYSVLMVVLAKGHTYYVVDLFRGRVEFPDLLREALCLIKKHKPDSVLVEDASSGTALGQNLEQLTECKVKFIRQPPNMSKKDRLLAQFHTFEGGKIYFPQDAPWLAEFERELLGFPHVRHDDQVDALTIFLAEANAKKYNEVY